jgi:Family of unknown function (DUF6516)
MDLQTYISTVKARLNQSPVMDRIEVIEEKTLFDRGYFRARLTLSNGDFLEIAESFTIAEDRCITLGYRYQWMDAPKQQLRKRWDNVGHFPELPNFPHHVHVSAESKVEPSRSRNILELIDLIEQEVSNLETNQ